ncbi:MAG: DUF1330 domain-containing protein [Hyphomonas sp.]
MTPWMQTMAAGCALVLAGCASAPAPEVTATPKGYVIVEIDVTNPEAYEGYKAAAAALVEAAGGRYLVRGGKVEAREGAPPSGRVVILEYPSFDAAKAFLESPEYGEILLLRTDNTTSRLMIVEGTVP